MERVKFVTDTFINKMGRTEDFELGGNSDITVGRAGFPINTGVERWELDAYHSEFWHLGQRHYLFVTDGFETLVDKDTIWSLGSQYYARLSHQTFAFNLNINHAQDLDSSRQFRLGGNSGLRGYPARQFTGDKTFLMNMETRLFPPWNALGVAFGGVVFLDTGDAWLPDESINLADLHWAAGLGLRLGWTKLPGEPISRIDIGWPLGESGGPVVSFGVEQHF